MATADLLMVVGRVVFGGFFLIAGIRNFWNFNERRATSATNYGWPLPVPMLAIGFAMQFVGGALLLLNLWVVAGAAVLILFLLMATPLYHNLFLFHGKARDPHLYLTLVNITLCGGLLMVIGQAL
jgi:putative oxidoreductase